MTLTIHPSTHSEPNSLRLKEIKDHYNLKEDKDVITLALRVLEYSITKGQLCYIDEADGDVYYIDIG